MEKNLEILKKNILLDEKEYCFDRSYTSDEKWSEENPNETRLQAYRKVYKVVNSASLNELLDCYGDKYDHLFIKKEGGTYVD
ncbi:hypothetical protein [Bacillus sp. TE9122W]